jgi:hypothetical protein
MVMYHTLCGCVEDAIFPRVEAAASSLPSAERSASREATL